MEPIRASDAERDRVVDTLTSAAAEGRLTLEELAERTGSALSATSRDELDTLTSDLPRPPATSADATTPRDGTRWILGILGGGDRKGRWRISPRCVVVNLLGGADLDLRQAIVQGHETEIVVFSLMGGSTITVPEGVVVDAGGFALMGGNDVLVEGRAPAPGAPVLRIRAYSLMGGTDVRTGVAVEPRPDGRGVLPPRI